MKNPIQNESFLISFLRYESSPGSCQVSGQAAGERARWKLGISGTQTPSGTYMDI